MKPAPLPPDEADRLMSLHALRLLDTPPEERFDRITRLAQIVLGSPIARVSLVDAKRQWFKSSQGLPGLRETPRELSFCAHAILGEGIMEIPDLAADERFRDNPFVTGEPRLRFYAGSPISSPDGRRVGALCVADRRPRELTVAERGALKDLAALVEDELAASALGRSLALSRAFEQRFRRRNRVRLRGAGRRASVGLGAAVVATVALAAAAYMGAQSLAEVVRGVGLSAAALARTSGAQDGERRRLAALLARADAQTWTLTWIVLIGGASAAIAVLIYGATMRRDFSARERAEEETSWLNARLRAILDSAAQVAIIVMDLGGRITLYNAGAEQILGYKADEVVGRLTPAAFLGAEGIAAHARELSRRLGRELTPEGSFLETARAGGEYEWTCRRKDGGIRVMSVSMAGLEHDGRLAGVLAIGRDVTEQRRAREEMARARDLALEAAEAKSRFLANVSHEIRTPMNAILGMTGLLFDEESDPGRRERLGIVRTAADALLALINDVLDFTRAEAGKMRLEDVVFDLREVVARAAELFEERARGKGLALTTDISEDLPRALRGDPGRLRQVLLNLIGNAIKFTERGFVRVSVRRGAGASGEALRFEISDSGPGIAAEDVSRLFQSFSQLDSSSTRRHGGTGLGLAISRQLVERLDGRIGVESSLGRGATFWFELPLVVSAEPVPPAPPETVRAAPPRRLRVLVVEDNAVNRKVLLLLLERLGHVAEAVSSGREALESLSAIHYDLVLMDCQMPEMDGWEAARELRRRERASGAPRAQITALTANVLSEDRARCFEAGMDDFLAKPVRAEDLQRVLDEAASTPLNAAAVARFREMVGAEAFEDVFREFLRTGALSNEALAAAERAGDAEALRRTAHALKGAALSIGAERIAVLCLRLEGLEADAQAERHALVSRMASELDAVRRARA